MLQLLLSVAAAAACTRCTAVVAVRTAVVAVGAVVTVCAAIDAAVAIRLILALREGARIAVADVGKCLCTRGKDHAGDQSHQYLFH